MVQEGGGDRVRKKCEKERAGERLAGEREKNMGEREGGRSQELAGRGGGEDLTSAVGHAAIRFAYAEPRGSVAQHPRSNLRGREMMREQRGGEREKNMGEREREITGARRKRRGRRPRIWSQPRRNPFRVRGAAIQRRPAPVVVSEGKRDDERAEGEGEREEHGSFFWTSCRFQLY
jgi:hypothetical protein